VSVSTDFPYNIACLSYVSLSQSPLNILLMSILLLKVIVYITSTACRCTIDFLIFVSLISDILKSLKQLNIRLLYPRVKEASVIHRLKILCSVEQFGKKPVKMEKVLVEDKVVQCDGDNFHKDESPLAWYFSDEEVKLREAKLKEEEEEAGKAEAADTVSFYK